MKIELFLRKLEQALEIEDTKLNFDTNFKDIEEYDSFSVLSIIALIDEEFGEKISGLELNKISTVQELIDQIGVDHFE